jgi:2-iminoacetate synthase ThiH
MTLPQLDETLGSIPAALRPSVERHQANLARLMESLKAAGMSDTMIETAVTTLVDSYRQELTAAIKTLSAQHNDVNGGQ